MGIVEENLATITAEFEKRFAKVHDWTEPPLMPAGMVLSPSRAWEGTPFKRFLNGIDVDDGMVAPEGATTFEPGASVGRFRDNLAKMNVAEGDVLVWRKRPELEHEHAFATKRKRYTVYCRFAIVHPKPTPEPVTIITADRPGYYEDP